MSQTERSAAVGQGSYVRFLWVFLLSVAPLVLLWVCKVVIEPRPFYVGYYDPEVVYFYNSVDWLDGHTPNHVDHPGTPVQMIGAAIAAITGKSPFDFDRFRLCAYSVAGILSFIAVLALLKTVLARLPWTFQVAAIWSFFLTPAALEYLNIWCPEILYFPFGVLALIAVWALFRTKPAFTRALLAGGALGLCCALKFLFLPLVCALLVSILFWKGWPHMREWEAALASLLGVAAGFVGGTAIVISEYPRMFAWLFLLGTTEGAYASGEIGLPAWNDLLQGVSRLWTKGWLMYAFLLAWILIYIVFVLRGRKDAATFSQKLPARPLLIFSVTGFVLLHILVLRQPDPSYLLPGGLCVLLLVYSLYQGVIPCGAKSMRRIGGSVFVLVAVLLLVRVATVWRGHQDMLRDAENLRSGFARVLEEEAATLGLENPVTLYTFNFPQPSIALRTRARFRTRLREIESVFPYEGDYVPWYKFVYLPESAGTWHFLIIHRKYLEGFPQPVTAPLYRQGDYLLVANAAYILSL